MICAGCGCSFTTSKAPGLLCDGCCNNSRRWPKRRRAELGFALAQQPHHPNGVFSFKIALDFRAAP